MYSHDRAKRHAALAFFVLAAMGGAGCSEDENPDSVATTGGNAMGGSDPGAGSDPGGTGAGGAATGGAATGGTGVGGAATGGTGVGGAATGGAATGGTGAGGSTGGSSSGGAGGSTGGSSSGGAGGSTGGSPSGGAGGVPASCTVGCVPVRECDAMTVLWECAGDYDDATMLAGGCVDLATGVQRYCCPMNHLEGCLPQIWLEHERYTPGEPIDPRWENPTDESVFLPGCGTLELERQSGDEWEPLGPMVVCAWEGIAVEVPAGGQYVEPMARVSEVGTYRFSGAYSVGCTPDEALSEAGCRRGPVPVKSRTFTVE